jgi:hypothetical protein
MSGIVTVSDAFQRGNNFEMASGTGQTLNLSKDTRTLLRFEPKTIQLDRVTPLAHNVTMLENNKQPVFSKTFVTNGAPLSLELIAGPGNTTTTYGPDFWNRGAYYVEGPFLKQNANYIINVRLATINSIQPQNPISDEFSFRTVR